jgi:hypothetical protein
VELLRDYKDSVHYLKICAEENYDSWFRVSFVSEMHLRKNVTEYTSRKLMIQLGGRSCVIFSLSLGSTRNW